jgi:hypothetical protein
MDRLNRRRAKQSRIAEVRIKFAILSSQCKAAREWETSSQLATMAATSCFDALNVTKCIWWAERSGGQGA